MSANFNEIFSTEELDKLFDESSEKAIVLFKHSTTCPISSSVYYDIFNAGLDVNLIVVQHSRNVSNRIAEKTGIRHESPQAIVLKNGEPVYHASHFDITSQDLENALKS